MALMEAGAEHWLVRVGSAGAGLGARRIRETEIRGRWVGSAEPSPGLLTQANKLSRRSQNSSLRGKVRHSE